MNSSHSNQAQSAAIRRCTPQDLAALCAIGRETYEQTFASLNTPENMAAHLAAAFNPQTMGQELANPASAYYFISVGGELAGYLKLNEAPAQTDLQDENALEIQRIYIRRSFAKQGLGGKLLAFAEAEARRRGKSALWLGVWEKNPNAIGFYGHAGFVQTGSHPYRLGDDLQTDYILYKTISEPAK